MKTIKLKYLDFNKGSYTTELGYEYFSGILSKKYKVELSDEPDYVIYSVFGQEHLNAKYDNCVKIFFTTECYTPNFNHCDYGIGYDRSRLMTDISVFHYSPCFSIENSLT